MVGLARQEAQQQGGSTAPVGGDDTVGHFPCTLLERPTLMPCVDFSQINYIHMYSMHQLTFRLRRTIVLWCERLRFVLSKTVREWKRNETIRKRNGLRTVVWYFTRADLSRRFIELRLLLSIFGLHDGC